MSRADELIASRDERFAAVPRPREDFLFGSELERYTGELAARPDLWLDLVEHDASQRRYVELFSDEYVTAWLICWMHDHDTGFHDHDVSWGAVAVIAGEVHEERLQALGPRREAVYSVGQTFHFSPADVHRVSHAGSEPAVTLHVYSPPLLSMGTYELDRDGLLHRRTISADQELQPADDEAALAGALHEPSRGDTTHLRRRAEAGRRRRPGGRARSRRTRL
ncbi:MAG TPA: cysteine dioxygenase family protein [Solirubrobacteraceae bacterium]|nr:cysteine dioxygenase family protein [Solirubrobacteraceae bacterium]